MSETLQPIFQEPVEVHGLTIINACHDWEIFAYGERLGLKPHEIERVLSRGEGLYNAIDAAFGVLEEIARAKRRFKENDPLRGNKSRLSKSRKREILAMNSNL